MKVSELTPELKKYWRHIISETKYVETAYVGPNSNSENHKKNLNLYEKRMGKTLEDVLNINNEASKEFLLQLLDEPLPLLWGLILNTIAKSDDQIYIDAIREFSETSDRIIDPMIYRGTLEYLESHPEGLKQNDLRNFASLLLKEKGVVSREALLNTSDIDLIRSIVENFPAKEWIDPLYKKLERNMSYISAILPYSKAKRRGENRTDVARPQDLVEIHKPNKADLNMMDAISYWIGLNVDKDSDYKIIEDLYDFYQIQFRDWITREDQFKAFSNVFNVKKFTLEELLDVLFVDILAYLPIQVDGNGNIEDSREGQPYLKFIHDLKSRIAEQAELKDLINLNGFLTRPFPNTESRTILAQNETARAILMEIIAEVSNTLVKEDKGLSDTIGAVMAQNPTQQYATANLKQTIEERRCCKMHGRTGDTFCNICGRVIPEEFRVED